MKKNIFVLGLIFLFSCNGNKNDKKQLENSIEPVERIVETQKKLEIDEDFSKSAELFANDVLKEKIRIEDFELNDLKKVKFLDVFQIKGLYKITAYSNKHYPKNSEPNYYEHFTLFVANYKSEKDAIFSYNEIKSYLDYQKADLKDFDKDIARKVSLLTIGAKSGGMITQKGKQVMSLVETCRGAPIQGNWIDYEKMFLNFITKDGEDIEVLNSDCGMFNYKIELRKSQQLKHLSTNAVL